MFDTDYTIGLKKGKVPIKNQHFCFHGWQNSISPTQMNLHQIFERQNHNRLGFQPLIFMIVIFIIKASAVGAVIEAVWFNYWQCETRDHTLGACGTVLLSLNIIVDIFRKLVIFFITVLIFTRPTIVTSSLQGLPAVNVDSKDISSRSKCEKRQNQKFTNIIHHKYLHSLLNRWWYRSVRHVKSLF